MKEKKSKVDCGADQQGCFFAQFVGLALVTKLRLNLGVFEVFI